MLEDAPTGVDLSGTSALLLSGARDPFARMAPALEAALRQGGADLDARILPAGHELSPDDLAVAQGWLAARA